MNIILILLKYWWKGIKRKYHIFLFVLLLTPFVSSAQVYDSIYERDKAIYEENSMKQCGKLSCIPDLEQDVVVVEEVKVESPKRNILKVEKVEVESKEIAEMKAQIVELQKLIQLLIELIEAKHGKNI